MSFATINQAANDPQLRARVDAAAQKEARLNPTFGETVYGQQLIAGTGTGGAMPAGVTLLPSPLMWGVAVDTEAAYEAALLAGRGAPGHDKDIITDAMITGAVQAHWPPDPVQGVSTLNTSMMPLASAVPQTAPPPSLSPEEEALRMEAPGNGEENVEPA